MRCHADSSFLYRRGTVLMVIGPLYPVVCQEIPRSHSMVVVLLCSKPNYSSDLLSIYQRHLLVN